MGKEEKINEEKIEKSVAETSAEERSLEKEVVNQDSQQHSWYIIQCFSGQEYKVRTKIEKLVEEKKWKKKLVRVLVPEEETIEIKNNKRLEKITKIFPGYVFIEADLDESMIFNLSRITGVSKFIGDKNNPTPVKEDEILRVLRKVGDKTKKIEIDFEINEVIKIIDGPFRGYTGSISDINVEKGKLKSLISIFGRETPVELDFNQVEKVIN